MSYVSLSSPLLLMWFYIHHIHIVANKLVYYMHAAIPPNSTLVHMQSIQTSFNMVLQVFMIPIKALYLIQYIKMYAKLIVCHTKIHHLWYKHVILTLRRLVTTKYVALKISNSRPLTQFFCHSLMRKAINTKKLVGSYWVRTYKTFTQA